MILVTGATGTVGREVVSQLLAAGQNVRAMSRNPAKARFDSRVTAFAGDFSKPETLARAAEGVEKMFSLTFGPDTGVHESNLAQVAKNAGVRHIVKLSVIGVGHGEWNRIADWHSSGEQAIRDSGIPWTFVRPGAFMSNALFWTESVKHQGKVYSNYGDGKLPSIHPRDIAAVAARALTTDGHQGKIYPVTGPEALSISEQVQILSTVIGKPIEYVRISDEQARVGMQKSGMPGFLIDVLLPFASFIRSGKAAEVLTTVQQVTGREPFTFADWARECAAAFS
jgi:uncharacterized protein YbjT (DUF2867 family)